MENWIKLFIWPWNWSIFHYLYKCVCVCRYFIALFYIWHRFEELILIVVDQWFWQTVAKFRYIAGEDNDLFGRTICNKLSKISEATEESKKKIPAALESKIHPHTHTPIQNRNITFQISLVNMRCRDIVHCLSFIHGPDVELNFYGSKPIKNPRAVFCNAEIANGIFRRW